MLELVWAPVMFDMEFLQVLPEACAGVLPCLISAPRGQTALTVFLYFLAVVLRWVIFALVGEISFRHLSFHLALGVAATRPGRFGTTVSRAPRVSAEAPFPRRACSEACWHACFEFGLSCYPSVF